MKKKPKPIGNGNYTVCRTCRGTGYKGEVKKYKSNNPNIKQALVAIDCPDCRDGTGNSRGWVDAER